MTTTGQKPKFFGPLGVTNIRTFVDPQNPSQAGLLMEIPDMDAFSSPMQSQAAADAIKDDGSSRRRWSS